MLHGQILCDSPMHVVDRGLGQKPVSASQQRVLGLWNRAFTFEGHLLACYWTLIETTKMTKSHKIILKPEVRVLPCVMSDKHSGREGSAQKSP